MRTIGILGGLGPQATMDFEARLQEGRANEEDTQAVREAATALRARQVDGIIPGCTELPLLLPAHIDEPDLINSTQLLAEAAVRFALG
jgi:aspartate racemase